MLSEACHIRAGMRPVRSHSVQVMYGEPDVVVRRSLSRTRKT